MTALRAVVFGLFGLTFGSFLTVVIHRLPRGGQVVSGRSMCPACGHTITWTENIPVLSFLVLRGRCRGCGARISVEYPLVELVTALLFAAAGARFASVWVGAAFAAFFAVLVAVAAIDLHHRLIPNRIIYPALAVFAVAVAGLWLGGRGVTIAGAGWGLLAYAGLLFVIALVSPRGMGMGDVKLAALIGMVLGGLGFGVAVAGAAFGILGGGVGGVVALALGRSRKDAIPFGPYMAAGAVAAAMFGPQIVHWYTGLLG